MFCRNEELSDYKKLSDFDANFVLEIVASLLNVIQAPEVPFKSVKPPISMSARYKMGSSLAEHCKNLGFVGQDIGYQTFIYCQEHELRSVLMFLIDKLPKDSDLDDFQPKNLGK